VKISSLGNKKAPVWIPGVVVGGARTEICRGTWEAVLGGESQIRGHLQAGYQAVYDADLKAYFETIPHENLLACLRQRVTDRSVLGLSRRWLETLVVELGENGTGGKRTRNEKGTPQGRVSWKVSSNWRLTARKPAWWK